MNYGQNYKKLHDLCQNTWRSFFGSDHFTEIPNLYNSDYLCVREKYMTHLRGMNWENFQFYNQEIILDNNSLPSPVHSAISTKNQFCVSTTVIHDRNRVR